MLDMCDIHGHFLPGMDDGCQTPDEAIALLRYSYAAGIRRMCATPHYYPVESVEDFLRRRQESMQRLSERIAQLGITDIPQILLGAEVAYRQGLSSLEDLDKLCLGASRYMLLELPFEPWNNSLLRDVRNICCARGITPIFAHIERYLSLQSGQQLKQVLSCGGLVQVNAGSLLKFPRNLRVRGLIAKGQAQLLGSDCHNMQERKPNLHLAHDWLIEHRLYDRLQEMAQLSCEVFEAGTL